jgi:transposase
MKSVPFVLAALASAAFANTAPTVVIQSAAMRPGTTLMDVVYRVNDPDDATVKTRALAFVDGVRSFANVLKPVTFVEGTAAKLGDAIPSNTNHTLTWDVATDWNVDLGQVKFEVLAMDARGLLPIDWITIPAAGGKPALTISRDTPSDSSALNALFWQYASGDAGLTLVAGKLRGNLTSGNFAGVNLATGTVLDAYSSPFLFKRMNLDPSLSSEVSYGSSTARAGLLNTGKWHASNRAYNGIPIVMVWGNENLAPPSVLSEITAISAGNGHCLGIIGGGRVVSWGNGFINQVPLGLSGVTAVSAGRDFSLALKSDGTVVAWGQGFEGQTTVPPGLSGVIAIAAGGFECLALKNNGTVVAWGGFEGGTQVPEGLTGVTAIATSQAGRLALKNDQSVVAWGGYEAPVGLSGVTAISAGADHFLALKSNGTVVAWGENWANQTTVPSGLSGVIAISAGNGFSVALKNDGTVVAWGYNSSGQTLVPADLSGVTSISAGGGHVMVLKAENP